MGHYEIWARHPQRLFEKSHFNLKMESGRIQASQPVGGDVAEVYLAEDGCVHIFARTRQTIYCPAPSLGSSSFSGPLGSFSTELRDEARTLRIIVDNQYADLELGGDAASAELRRHPELLGAIVRIAGLPRSEDGLFINHPPP
jgi:hypothetical protein